jgi:hypothetical protein
LQRKREVLLRTVYKKIDDESFMSLGYSVEDERWPSNTARMDCLLVSIVAMKEGGGGKASDVWRMCRIDAKSSFGFKRKVPASIAFSLIVPPIVDLKSSVELMLDEYEPVRELEKDEAGVVVFTWRSHLLKMCLECAQGVQYLHHERYWSDGENDAKEGRQKEAAGWRECIIHR